MKPRPKWTPARRAFKEAPWRQQRLPSRASSSVATAKSRPISRQFGKPRGTRNPDTVDWKKARRWEKRHGNGDELEVDEPRDEPTATVGAYQRAEAKPTSWRDWPIEPFPRLGRNEYVTIHRRLSSSSSSGSDEPSAARTPSPSFDSGDRRYTPARYMPTAAPIPKSASAQWLLNHASRASGQSQRLRIERDWQDADAESQDTAESSSSRVVWGNRQQAELLQAVLARQARQELRRSEEPRQADADTASNVWALLDRN